TLSEANPLWAAPRIHGELLKLGVEVSEATVAKYMGRRHKPPSQTWRTFLTNHAQQVAVADFFVVPDGNVSPLVRALDPRPRASTRCPHRGDRSPDGRVDRSTTPRSVSVERRTALSRARSRYGVPRLGDDGAGDRDRRGDHSRSLTVAERLRRAI